MCILMYIIMQYIFLESGSKSRAGPDGRVSCGKPLTSPVPREPAKPGGRGTSKSKRIQNSMDSASHSLVSFITLPGVTLQKMSLRSGRSSGVLQYMCI